MKRCVTLLLSLLLLCSCALADASQARYNSTRAFLEQLDGLGVTYTLSDETDEAGNEIVKIDFVSENGSYTYTVGCFFASDNSVCYLRGYNVVSYTVDRRAFMLQGVNTLNADGHFVRYIVDDTDNTVTVASDVLLSADGGAQQCLDALVMLCAGFELAHDQLSLYLR